MVAPRSDLIEEVGPEEGKTDLDLGIEESIRRCEALLAMVPLSLQSSLSDGSFGSMNTNKMVENAAHTCLDMELENSTGHRLEFEPEWKKNMWLLSSIKDGRSTSPQVEVESYSSNCSITPSKESSIEKVQKRTSTISRSCPSPVLSSPTSHLDLSLIEGTRSPDDEVVHKRIHIRRRFARGSEGSSASEDWTVDSSQVDTTVTSVSGSQYSHSFKDAKIEGDLEEADTQKSSPTPSMLSNLSRSSQQSFETMRFMFSTPQTCEEAWEWFDKHSVAASPDSKYEESVVHEVHPRRYKPVKHFLHSWWKPHNNGLNQMHLTMKATKNAAKFEPDHGRTAMDLPRTASARTRKIKTVAAMESLKRLSRPRTALYQRCAQTKALMEEEQMSECSFKPIVGRRPDPRSKLYAPIVDRLGEMRQRVDFRKRARKVIEKEELDHCSFWPRINIGSVHLDMRAYQPIHERLEELLRKRDERIVQARAQEAKDMGLSFKPEINQNSLRLCKQKALEAIDVPDRLTSSSLDGSGEPQAKLYRPKDECTFSPEINPNTDTILAGFKFEGCDFLSRQQQFVHKMEWRKRMKEQEVPINLTFQPKTGNASFILRFSPFSECNDETLTERVHRLAHGDSQHRCRTRQRISDNYYAQFDFQPQINKNSRSMGRTPTIRDLYVNESGKRRKAAQKQKVYQELHEKCTFHPEVNVHKSSDEVENILHHRRKFRKDEAKSQEAERVMKEVEEVKECTFTPTVNPMPPKEKEPVVIKGLGRHLELQDRAKQMKRDQEEWERKVFFSHVTSHSLKPLSDACPIST